MFILLFDRLTGGFSFLNFHVIWITKNVSHMYFRMQKNNGAWPCQPTFMDVVCGWRPCEDKTSTPKPWKQYRD